MKQIDPLILWYKRNQRILPWRENKDPYRVWLSEIILQQTRVDQGIPYFFKLLHRYPDIQSLANSSESDLLALWAGLGYYSRALNLLKTARIITSDYNGIFPNTYLDLLALPGIGPYTAAAIASICFDLPYPAIDGNAIRVYSRLGAIEGSSNTNALKNKIINFASPLFSTANPGIINQAIMELGATICSPQNPKCTLCPLNSQCQALQNDSIALFPYKNKKLQPKNRTLNYLLLFKNDYSEIALVKRDHSDIWKGLLQPIPISESQIEYQRVAEEITLNYISDSLNPPFQPVFFTTLTHILSHQRITAHFFIAAVTEEFSAAKNFSFYPLHQINILPLPALFIKLFKGLPFYPKSTQDTHLETP